MKKSNQFIEAMSSDILRTNLKSLNSSFDSVIKNSIGFLYDKEEDKLHFIYRKESNYPLVYAASSVSNIAIPLKGKKTHTFYLFTEEDKRMQPEDVMRRIFQVIETGNRSRLQRVIAYIFNL